MSDELDAIRRELEEVRRLKESLKEELEEVRESRSEIKRRERELRHHAREAERVGKPPKPPRPVPPVRIDLSGLTDRLDSEMERIGVELEKSFKGLETAFSVPGLFGTSRKRAKRRDRDIERIGPERVAKVISPLGSEERLRILDYLKDGPKTFNDLELHTEKTGSSLTHHLNPLIEAGYVIKGEVRGTYYVTVEGRLAYRLAQWITSKVEDEVVRRNGNGAKDQKDSPKSESVIIRFDDEEDLEDLEDIEEMKGEKLDELQDQLHDELDEIQGLEEELEDAESEEDEF